MISSDKLGVVQANFTIIKDGVDLKSRFYIVLDKHLLSSRWSIGVKNMIVTALFDEVMKDASK